MPYHACLLAVQEVRASFFFEGDITKASKLLHVLGVVNIIDSDLVAAVTTEVQAAAGEYGCLHGDAIFLRPKNTADGALCYDPHDGGRILMTNGEGGRRLQAPLNAPMRKPQEPGASATIAQHATYAQEVAKHKRTRELAEIIKPVAKKAAAILAAVAGPDLRIRNSMVLVNEPVEPPVGIQCLHCDLPPFAKGFVGLLALSRYTILVSPASHHAVQAHQMLMDMHPNADESEIMCMVSAPKLVRLVIEPGELVLLHGNIIHAGDMGSAGELSPRIHFYVIQNSVDNETLPAIGMGPLFEAMFWP